MPTHRLDPRDLVQVTGWAIYRAMREQRTYVVLKNKVTQRYTTISLMFYKEMFEGHPRYSLVSSAVPLAGESKANGSVPV